MNLEDPKIIDAVERFGKALVDLEGRMEVGMVKTPMGEMPHPTFVLKSLMQLKMENVQLQVKVLMLDAIVTALVQKEKEPEQYIANIFDEHYEDLVKIKEKRESKILVPKGSMDNGILSNRG